MRTLPVLVAVVCFLLAAQAVIWLVRPVPAQPPTAPPVVVTISQITEPPRAPAEQLADAVRQRRWALAGQLVDQPAVADDPRLAAWRDAIRRGGQRDTEGVIESPHLRGSLASIGPADARRYNLRQLAPGKPSTLPEKRRGDLLVYTPRILVSEAIISLADELRILDIAGLELNAAGTPLPELAGIQLRYLGGSAIDRVPAAVFVACLAPEIVDLSARREDLAGVLAALAGRTSLRVLRLPTSTSLGPAALTALATVTGLEELTCSATGLNAVAIAQLQPLTRLRVLRLENQLPADALRAIGHLVGLRQLSCTVSGPGDLAPLATLPELDELTLAVAGPDTDPAGLAQLGVTTLRLSQAGVDDRFAAAVSGMSGIDHVALSSTALTDAGLLRLAGNGQLRAVELGENPGITGACLPALLRSPTLHDLRLASATIPPIALLTCPDPGQLERFTWAGAAIPPEVLDHLVAWPGMVRVSLSGRLDAAVKQRLDDANARRGNVPPDLPDEPAIGF